MSNVEDQRHQNLTHMIDFLSQHPVLHQRDEQQTSSADRRSSQFTDLATGQALATLWIQS